ncbi:MAG TPA: serine/threonine-protein kinase [Tepidisphaeraceae bacterium]|jgi:serine/threonine-protein kinase
MSTAPASHAYAASDTMPKSLFGYEVLDFIGEGAGSLIYVVSEEQSNQIYALKHVIRHTDRDARFIEQLQNEYEIGRQIDHLHLRRAIALKEQRTLLRKVTEAGLLLEMFDGLPLDMQDRKDNATLVDIFIQTAQGLEALHAAGFVHCDLKPNNILVDARNQVKVIDLGQACKVGTCKERIQGTPDYIAPEQVKREPVTVRTDVFNFGATMYWALCGRKLPTLFTLRKTENSFLVDDQMAAPHTINPATPENLSNLVMECVRTNPNKRPHDMKELTSRLEIMYHRLSRQRRPGAA